MRQVSGESAARVKRPFTGAICVIGRGRWGASLLAALRSRGVPALVADPRKPRIGGWLEAEVFWLCVPDAEIASAARQVMAAFEQAGTSMRRRVFLHSSGVHSSQVLDFARAAGSIVASVHPLMSFPTRKPVALAGIPFAIEADGALRRKLFRLVRLLGGEPFAIRAEGKVLYHAAAVMASPLLVSLAAAVEETARAAGLSARQAKALLEPIMTVTLANFFRQGGAQSFSGPFARGDAQTVSLHLAALRAHPELGQIYKTLALYALDRLPVGHPDQLRQSLTVLQRSSKAPRV